MRIVALLAVRNEERYLGRCLEHLYQQGIETCLIDNGSIDRTLEIARSFLDRGVIRIEHLPFTGVFELETQLRYKEQLAAEISADWFIHYDADEIRQAPKPYRTLREGIEAADRRGYTAIDFDEFVFLPTADDQSFEGRDYVEEMRYYYYFECDSPARYRTNAWKKHPEVDLHTFAGHKVVFPGLKVCPDPFILRHYIVLSRAHAIEKYAKRGFSESEMAKSWHRDRASFRADEFSFPARDRLKKIDAAGDFDKSKPWKSHPLFSVADSSRNARVINDKPATLIACNCNRPQRRAAKTTTRCTEEVQGRSFGAHSNYRARAGRCREAVLVRNDSNLQREKKIFCGGAGKCPGSSPRSHADAD